MPSPVLISFYCMFFLYQIPFTSCLSSLLLPLLLSSFSSYFPPFYMFPISTFFALSLSSFSLYYNFVSLPHHFSSSILSPSPISLLSSSYSLHFLFHFSLYPIFANVFSSSSISIDETMLINISYLSIFLMENFGY